MRTDLGYSEEDIPPFMLRLEAQSKCIGGPLYQPRQPLTEPFEVVSACIRFQFFMHPRFPMQDQMGLLSSTDKLKALDYTYSGCDDTKDTELLQITDMLNDTVRTSLSGET